MYPNRGFWIHVSIFLVLDTSTWPYVSAIRCATTVCIYTVWGHFGEHQRMQPLGHMCYRRQFQNKVTATYHWLDRGRSSGQKVAGAVLEVFANVDRPRIHTIYRQRTGCHHCKFRSVVIPLFSWCQGLSPHPGSPHLMRLPS